MNQAPNAYSFDLQLPDSVEVMLQPNGSVQFVPTAAASGQLKAQGIDASFNFGGLDIPWAQDANGRDIATHYSIDGNTVIQHVDLASAKTFPVIADPKMTWKGFYATLKYSKAETRNMRDQGVVLGGLLVSAAGFAAFGPPGGAIAAVMIGVGATTVGIIAATATNAVGDGKCLAVDVPSMYPTIVKC